MNNNENLKDRLISNSNKILEILNEKNQVSSWELKMKLNLSSSELYLTLGYLLSNEKIIIVQENLIYKIMLNKN